MDLPPQYSLLVALIIGVLVAIGAVYRFFADLSKPSDAVPDMRMLGAALGDSQALNRIGDELTDIKVLMQRHLDTDKTPELVHAVERCADAMAKRATQPRPPRRRG